MASLLNDSERIERALRPVIRRIVEEETRSCMRVMKAVVSTAPDAQSGLCGVKLIGEDSELILPFSSAVAGVAAGDCVLVAVIYGSWRNAIVWERSPIS